MLFIIQLFLYVQSFLFGGDGSVAFIAELSQLNETRSEAAIIFEPISDCIDRTTFMKAYAGVQKWNPCAEMIAIADFSKPSDQQRFYIIDLTTKEIVLQTWVAHGKNSGDNFVTQFSNKMSSHMSSKGFYLIEETFESPKHGTSLALDGLEKGINDKAREREIIMHGANYVSEEFIEENGRCGRSYGCPALSKEDMQKALQLLKPGSILYIHS
ncbi:MAG: murein L,D-transpeptidase catalytic domain family protein [Bacteroidia bacterium]